MAFFDEIGKTLADKSREAAKKAKDVAEILQLKAQISTEKSKTKELYASIGVLYFKKHRDDENDEYQMFFPEIRKAVEEKWDSIKAYTVDTENDKLVEFTLTLGELTDEERQIILKGCLINYNRVD